MATNSNTKQMLYQANSFNKGMDADTTDMLISDESYRLAKNLRYITDAGESTGELRLIEGAKEIEYETEDSDSSNYLSEDYTVRAFNSMRNVGALVCQKEDDSWAVFRMDSNGTEWTTQLVFGWCTDALSQDVKLSTVLKYEDTDQLQLYIADGQHQLMKINLYDTTGSSDIKYVTNGRLFSELGKVRFRLIIQGGQLDSGLVQYAYRLYNENNTSTQMSPLSGLRAILNKFSTIGPIGLHGQTKSSIGLQLGILVGDVVSSIYTKIQLYRIQYLVNGQLPKIQLIYDGEMYLNDDKTFIYDDFGMSSLLDLTVEEFNSVTGIYILPQLIESKNNILFAGNIKYDIDVLDEDILNMDFRAFSTGDIIEGTSTHVTRNNLPSIDQNAINSNLYLTEDYDENDWHTIQDDQSSKIGGWGPNIDWEFDVSMPYVINEFPTSKHANTDELKIANDQDTYWDPNPSHGLIDLIGTVKRGLMHDEIYRYGIVLYSKYGTKYPVKWIADIRTPSLNSFIGADEEGNNLLRTISDIYNKLERSHILHPVFRIHEYDELERRILDPDKISGYEIVRVHRTVNDIATISQGIIASTVQHNHDGLNEVSCSGMPFLDHIRYITGATLPGQQYPSINDSIVETNINVLLFYSPEVTYQSDDILLILKQSNDFYLLCLYPIATTTGEDPTEPEWIIYSDDVKYLDDGGIVFYGPYASNNMYSYEEYGYRPYYVLFSPNLQDVDDHDATHLRSYRGRFKWYNWNSVRDQFLKYESLKSDNFLFNDLFGLNVYKLHRKQNGGIPQHVPLSPSKEFVLNYNIDDSSLVKPIDYNELITSSDFNGKQYLSQVGDYTFFHCVAPYIIENKANTFGVGYLVENYLNNLYRDELIATCDTSLALHLNPYDVLQALGKNIIQFFYGDDNYGREDTISSFEYSLLCNLRRNIIPYGGFSKYSRDNSTYIQHGYYYTLSTNEDEPVNKKRHIYDGDTTVSEFEFTPARKWYDATHVSPRCTIVCQVAVESSIDVAFDHGEKFSNNKQENPTLVLVNPCNFNDIYIQKTPSYLYNTAYSIDPQLLLINYSNSVVQNSLKDLDYRVHYSNPASNNQAADPWLIFQPLNYLDVDNSHGPITELRTFKDLLIFWQEKAMGVLSVNERVQIATDSNLPLILGTGGVLERYDYLTTANGMKENQHADTQSDHTLYWWDYDNNTICAYSRGSVPVQLSKVKSVQNILNRASKNNKLTQSNISTGIYPLLTYDKKYNEVLFKIGQLEKLDKVGIHKGDAGLKDSDNDNVLVYNEQQAQFSSIYEIDPQCYFNIEQKLFFMNREDDKYAMYRWNSGNGEQSLGFNGTPLLPYLKYVINNQKGAVKVYDNVEFAGRIPSGDTWDEESQRRSLYMSTLDEHVKFEFNTPLKQVGKIDGTKITNRQLDFKFAIPRNGYQDEEEWITKEYGDRMRGKTMQCEIYSDINSLDFSLLYILTKYRMSWG